MSNQITITVSGITGQQGGSVARQLLKKGFKVRGVTRNPDSDKARPLIELGAELSKGEFTDTASLVEVLIGSDALFLMTTPFEAGIDAEIEQGKKVVDAAKEAGVSFVLMTSVANANLSTGIPHFDSKFKVAEYLKQSGLDNAIIAPAYFYENVFSPFVLPGLQNGTLAMALSPEKELQCVSIESIGSMAAYLFENRNAFKGRRIDIAGDSLTGPQTAQVISKVSGKSLNYFPVPIPQVREQSEDMALMYEWFEKTGYSVDIASLKQEFPDVEWPTFEEWASRQDWSVLSVPAQKAG